MLFAFKCLAEGNRSLLKCRSSMKFIPHPFVRATGASILLLLIGLIAHMSTPIVFAAEEPGSQIAEDAAVDEDEDVEDMHAALFVGDRYPSAMRCQSCHPNHFRQWSVSSHAYAMVSPIFNAMQAKLIKETNGTLGDFCIRCHTPVGMNLGEPTVTPYAERHPVSQEGVTCIACHRVSQAYGKVSGRRALDEGPLTHPVKGPTGQAEVVQQLIDQGEVSNDPNAYGRKIHAAPESFFQLADASFCSACHDVTGPDGFRLEEAFSHYNASPAAKAGTTCQDCHMGQKPGMYTGDDLTNYQQGPAAMVNGEWTRTRKLTNHMIVGPDQSIVHPGLFPHMRNTIRTNPDSRGLASIEEWLAFDVDAGWGTEAFESKLDKETAFPDAWTDLDTRKRARKIIDAKLELLEEYRRDRLILLRQGYRLGEIVLTQHNKRGLRFKLEVSNGTDGHPVPTGFDAERLVWLHVEVSDSAGDVIFKSGDLDPKGDLRNLHSSYVQDGQAPVDRQLFSLQGKFITRNLRGGEREQVLPVNHSFSPLPFVRPPRRSNILYGEPADVRKHRQSIPPLGSRWAEYVVPAKALSGSGPYLILVELKVGMLPVNLITAIQDVGMDYGFTAEMAAQALVESYDVLWTKKIVLPSPDE
jgi:nitrate/TMAO reductase-like tetraheme cytochrome c subunit